MNQKVFVSYYSRYSTFTPSEEALQEETQAVATAMHYFSTPKIENGKIAPEKQSKLGIVGRTAFDEISQTKVSRSITS